MKVTVTDALGLTTTTDVNLPIVARLALRKTVLPSARVGVAYKARIVAIGGVRPFTWRLRGFGLLPRGLRLNERTGQLAGTPRQAGIYRFQVQVSDKQGVRSAVHFVLRVKRMERLC